MQWKAYQPLIDPARLVFIDETWTKTNMAPLRGWGPRGERLVAKVPWGHWNTTTFIAALRVDRIDAPWLLDGPINGESFRVYVERELVPTLKPADIVIADNLGSHKNREARRAIRQVGARLILLPKYSPDLNPIEQVFAKLKHLLRKAAVPSRLVWKWLERRVSGGLIVGWLRRRGQPGRGRRAARPRSASRAQNSMAAVSAEGSTVCVLMRRLNSSWRRSMLKAPLILKSHQTSR